MPVFDGVRQNIVGIILVKKIIMLDPDDAVPVREVYMSIDNLPRFRDDMPLYDLLNKFQEGKSKCSNSSVVQAVIECLPCTRSYGPSLGS